MNKEKEGNEQKIITHGGKPESFWKKTEGIRDFLQGVMIVLIVIGVVVAFVAHLYLLLASMDITYKDDLNYCEYTYGLGWKQSHTSEIGYFCVFTEEDRNKIIHQMSPEDRKTRVCERKFYHPSYCG